MKILLDRNRRANFGTVLLGQQHDWKRGCKPSLEKLKKLLLSITPICSQGLTFSEILRCRVMKKHRIYKHILTKGTSRSPRLSMVCLAQQWSHLLVSCWVTKGNFSRLEIKIWLDRNHSDQGNRPTMDDLWANLAPCKDIFAKLKPRAYFGEHTAWQIDVFFDFFGDFACLALEFSFSWPAHSIEIMIYYMTILITEFRMLTQAGATYGCNGETCTASCPR